MLVDKPVHKTRSHQIRGEPTGPGSVRGDVEVVKRGPIVPQDKLLEQRQGACVVAPSTVGIFTFRPGRQTFDKPVGRHSSHVLPDQAQPQTRAAVRSFGVSQLQSVRQLVNEQQQQIILRPKADEPSIGKKRPQAQIGSRQRYGETVINIRIGF